jgi:hypothetical protein
LQEALGRLCASRWTLDLDQHLSATVNRTEQSIYSEAL